MTYALLLAFFRNDMGFGGNNGLTDFKDILGFDLRRRRDARGAVRRLGARAGARLSCVCRRSSRRSSARCWSRSAMPRAGRASSATGSSTTSSSSSTLSAMHGGHRRRALRAAGRHHQPGRVRAGQLDRDRDLGRRRRPRHAGRRRSSAPSSSTAAKTWFTGRFPEFWLFVLGALFVVVTLFLPRGIVGTVRRLDGAA